MSEAERGNRPKKEAKQPNRREQRFLIAPTPKYLLPPFVEPAGERFIDHLTDDGEVNVIRIIRPVERPGPQAPPVVVATMTHEHASRLAAMPELMIEVDQPLRYGNAVLPVADPAVTGYDEGVEVTVHVTDGEGEPVPDALVHLIAGTSAAPTHTDQAGRARIAVGRHELDAITGIYVRPQFDHWSAWLDRPQLSTSESDEVRITCTKIDPSGMEAWSRRALGIDRLPPNYLGHGARIAIIDSGVAAGHEGMADRITGGHDVIADDDKAWQQDTFGSGTFAAGLITATGRVVGSHTGLAPEAELLAYKVFPGGHCSDLFEAIDRCIAGQADVINLNLGFEHPSWLVARKLDEARQAGIACVAAAGNGSGPVAFPASLPTVLAVAAVGMLGTFPPESYHATQYTGMRSAEGYFPARCSPAGPELDLCAPGVGVISTLPPANLGAMDGTAVAAPQIAALAALSLAHHPDFRTVFQMRNAARVDHLFGLLRGSCRPLVFTDRTRAGFGLPDALAAVGMGPNAIRQPWGARSLAPLMAHVGG